MKRILAFAMALAFGFVTVAALAQQTQPKPSGSMASESTTKRKEEGKTTKVKTQTVVGTVKEYEAGKKIVVVGPKKKDYSFDLDQNAGVTGDISTGTKVKGTYTKDESGQKVTTVAPYGTSKKKTTKKAA